MTEQEISNQLAEIEYQWTHAKRKLAEAKRLWTETETLIIELKIKKDRLTEELRVFKKTSPIQPTSNRDLEVQAFRERNPEVCQMAAVRDEKLKEGK